MHEKHRERMRTRYHVSGFESFSEHEILEMILYHSIPRGDTNELAHTLIERFGGFAGVIEATSDELRSVKGIGESSAMLIKLIEASVRTYASGVSQQISRFDNIEKIVEFLWARLLVLDHERLYAMLFDNNMTLLDFVLLSEGTVNSASVPVRQVVERAFAKKAANVVLAHNHPHGVARSSPNDVALTQRLMEGLAIVDIPLLEHIIVTTQNFWPIVKNDCKLDYSLSRHLERIANTGFDPERFYNVDENTYCFTSRLEQLARPRR